VRLFLAMTGTTAPPGGLTLERIGMLNLWQNRSPIRRAATEQLITSEGMSALRNGEMSCCYLSSFSPDWR
jgi:hypothetical protein